MADRGKYRLGVYLEFIKDGSVMMSNRVVPLLDGKRFARRLEKKLRKVMFRSTVDSQVVLPIKHLSLLIRCPTNRSLLPRRAIAYKLLTLTF